MILKRIKKPSIVHKMPQDIRHHTFGLSRILYLLMLLMIVGFILNYIFSSYYLLSGDGFVDSEEETVSLEYDALIEDVFVENGDKVKAGNPIFSYDSIEFRTLLLKSYTDYAEIVTKRQSLNSNISRLKASIDASEDFFKNIEKARKVLDGLDKKGYTTTERVLTEEAREFTVLRDMLQFKAELASNLKALDEINLVVSSSQALVKNLVEEYSAGIKYATYDGVIARSNHYPGSVVKKGDPIMKFYYGPKYLTVLFEDSHVKKAVGDPVIVTLNGGAITTVGHIAFMGEYSADLPDEIKPRYRPPGRRNVGQVVIDEKIIEHQEMLSLAKVYKPMGMSYVCQFLDCNKSKNLIDKYNTFMDAKKEKSEKRLEALRVKNKEFIKEFEK